MMKNLLILILMLFLKMNFLLMNLLLVCLIQKVYLNFLHLICLKHEKILKVINLKWVFVPLDLSLHSHRS
nr:MAG TPA: hypothetical protein [Crassvirales sp.]